MMKLLSFEILYIFFNFQIFKFFGENFDPPTDGISTHLPMEYRPPYPWYIELPTYGILTPYPWYIDTPTNGMLTPLSMLF